MRMIDADALIEKYGNWYIEEGPEEGFIGTLQQLVDEEPIVQPEPCEDAVSRQAAIDALKKDMASLDHIIQGISANDVRLNSYVEQRNQINYDIDTIKHLPAAQPEPCEDALESAYAHGYTAAESEYRDKLRKCEDAVSRDLAIEKICQDWCYGRCTKEDTGEKYCDGCDDVDIIKSLPSVTPKPRTEKCVWCGSPFRIEYYWIDKQGCTASFQDEERHMVATGIAKYCPNCGRKMQEGD